MFKIDSNEYEVWDENGVRFPGGVSNIVSAEINANWESLQWGTSQLPTKSVFVLLAMRSALAQKGGSWICNNPIAVGDKTVIDVKADVSVSSFLLYKL